MNKNISISLLNAKNIPKFLEDLKYVKSKLNKIRFKDVVFDIHVHFDIIDNNFVNGIGNDLKDIKLAKKMGFYTDVHFMVGNPGLDEYIKEAISYRCRFYNNTLWNR